MNTMLALPMPDVLPDGLTAVGERLSRLLGELPCSYTTAMGDGPDAVTARATILAWLAERQDARATSPDGSGASEVHDRFFAVRRSDGDAAEVLAEALLMSDMLMRADLDNSGSTLEPDPEGALLGVTEYLTDRIEPAGKIGQWTPALPAEAAGQRWAVGHQRFFVMLQLLVICVKRLREPASVMRQAELVYTFGWLCRSTAVAMRYAADFPADLYPSVRETMAPPAVNAGFSGLQTRDHQELIVQMRRLSSGRLSTMAAFTSAALYASMQHLYDAHVWVCERFGGAQEPSLLMEHSGGQQESGVQAAERLADKRLKLLQTR